MLMSRFGVLLCEHSCGMHVDTSARKKGQMLLKRLLHLHRDFMAFLYGGLWLNSNRDLGKQAVSQPPCSYFCDFYAFNVGRRMFQFVHDRRVDAVQCSP